MAWNTRWGCVYGLILLLVKSHRGMSDLTSILASGVANPLSGQGRPPNTTLRTTDFPVAVQVDSPTILAVDESSYTVTLYMYWLLTYEDDRVLDLMNRDYTETGCQRFCSSRPALYVNKLGLPVCCDGVYIPQAEADNVRGYNLQDFPLRYEVMMITNTTVNAFVALQGTFAYTWDYTAFPFDRHIAVLQIQTGFMPVINNPGGALTGEAVLLATDGFVIGADGKSHTNPDDYRPAVANQALPEWGVQRIWMETLNFTYVQGLDGKEFASGGRSKDLQAYPNPYTVGVRVYIELQRQQQGFFILVTIVPIALITIFGFGAHSLRVEATKSRIELIAILFLSLVLLQFTMQAILPAAYTLSLPFQLILVGYIYSFLSFIICIIASTLDSQWKRRAANITRRRAAMDFQKWEKRLMRASSTDVHCNKPARTVDQGQGDRRGYKLSPDIEAGSAVNTLRRRNEAHNQAVPESRLMGVTTRFTSFKIESDESWLARQKKSWLYRIYPLRVLLFFWKYIGKMESREYCARVAYKFDTNAHFSLLVTYLGVAIGLCCYAASRSQQAAYEHVLKPAGS